tara:strand:- start:1630 stop:1893 length:264 start_codon:yes stop_codon:yes gene_type:complete
MSNKNKLCRVRIVTDCTTSGIEDVNEETLVKVLDLKEIYYDLLDNSKIIIEKKRLTAVNGNRLLSILILDQNLIWSKIISCQEKIKY